MLAFAQLCRCWCVTRYPTTDTGVVEPLPAHDAAHNDLPKTSTGLITVDERLETLRGQILEYRRPENCNGPISKTLTQFFR
jgi:hypothetical protein